MAASRLISTLKNGALSANAKVLTDPKSSEFEKSMERWTDLDKQMPYAIVMPATEDDIVKSVKHAVEASVPFVAKSGGHSSWSTIGSDGFVLDLGLLRGVEVDADKKLAVISAGARIADVHAATCAKGFCGALGSGNTVGAIPSSIGGGLSALQSLVGFGSDQIVSCRLVTATGDLISVSDSSNPDLLYAIKGAGQFFGIITSLSVKVHPFSILGTPENTVWSGQMVFDISRAKEVVEAMVQVQKVTKRSAGLCIIGSPPPTFKPCVMLLAFFLGTAADAEADLKPVLDLKPDMYQGSNVPYERINDSIDMYCVTGGYKAWGGAGLYDLVPDDIVVLVEKYKELVAKCPDAIASAYGLEWCAKGPGNEAERGPDSAFSHRDVVNWVELLQWYTSADSHTEVSRIEQETLAYLRRNQPKDMHSVYPNWTRAEPVEMRYRGEERLGRLRALKKKWDPKGVFTREFL